MNDLDRHFAALIACACNPNLTRTEALERMGVMEKQVIKDRKNSKSIGIEELPRITYLYEVELKNMTEIADMYNSSQTTISLFLRKNGVKTRHQGYISSKLGVVV